MYAGKCLSRHPVTPSPSGGRLGWGWGRRSLPHPHPNPLLRFKCALALESIGIYTSLADKGVVQVSVVVLETAGMPLKHLKLM